MNQFFNPISAIAEDYKVVATSKKIYILPHGQFVTHAGEAAVFYNAKLEYGTVGTEEFCKISGTQKTHDYINDKFPTFEAAKDLYEERFITKTTTFFGNKTIYRVHGIIEREFGAETYIKASNIERIINHIKLNKSSIKS